MKLFLRRSMRARFALLAMVALLWSQVVLAAHPLCSASAVAMSEIAMAVADGEGGCNHDKASLADEVGESLCVAHCSQGDLTNDVARVPTIPALPAALPAAIVSIVLLTTGTAPHPGLPPAVSWHRPTAHPAALLLI